jgi:hypothetical protein
MMVAPFQSAAASLICEAFEGREDGRKYTWFVQDREALLPSMNDLTAQQVSAELKPGVATIGAHYNHILFALTLVTEEIRGGTVEGTWESSWEKQSFSADEWHALQSKIREEYEFFLGAFTTKEDWPDDHIIAGLAILPHMAFHLGAIRQLMKFL